MVQNEYWQYQFSTIIYSEILRRWSNTAISRSSYHHHMVHHHFIISSYHHTSIIISSYCWSRWSSIAKPRKCLHPPPKWSNALLLVPSNLILVKLISSSSSYHIIITPSSKHHHTITISALVFCPEYPCTGDVVCCCFSSPRNISMEWQIYVREKNLKSLKYICWTCIWCCCWC